MAADLINIILGKKSLSRSSARTYSSILRSMFLRLDLNAIVSNESISRNLNVILKYVAGKLSNERKQLLSAILIFIDPSNTKALDLINNLMRTARIENQLANEKQLYTTKQKKAWLSWADILNVRNKLEKSVEHLWDETQLSAFQLQHLQDYIIVCLYTYNPPRRALDYCLMTKQIPLSKAENGIEYKGDDMYFIFQKYKTAKDYGTQKIKVNESLKGILSRWFKINNSLFVLQNIQGGKITSSGLTKRLAKIFMKPGFGVNMLRHAFVSDVTLKDMPFVDELKEVATQLGHNPNETILYKKRN